MFPTVPLPDATLHDQQDLSCLISLNSSDYFLPPIRVKKGTRPLLKPLLLLTTLC